MLYPLLRIYDVAIDPVEELFWVTGGWIIYGPVISVAAALIVLAIILIRRNSRKK